MQQNKELDTKTHYYQSLILENTRECAWVYSMDKQTFKYISPSIYQLRGLTVEEAMSEPLSDSLTPRSYQKLLSQQQRRYELYLAGDRSDEVVYQIMEYEQYCKDGSIIVVEVSTKCIRNEADCTIDMIGISRDITRRKRDENRLFEKIRSQVICSEQMEALSTASLSNVRIQFFDQFQVFGPTCSQCLQWSISKNEELFAFLLSQEERTVCKDTILENLWPDTAYDKATTYLHNTLSSMKRDLTSVGIEFTTQFRKNHYSYKIPPYHSDLSQFISIKENTILSFDCVDDDSASAFETLLSLYQGDYLQKNGYLWSFSKGASLRTQFMSSAQMLARHYFIKHDYSSARSVLLKMLNIDSFDENVHELLLKIFFAEKNYSDFIKHYGELVDLLASKFNTSPKASLQHLYQVNSRALLEADRLLLSNF